MKRIVIVIIVCIGKIAFAQTETDTISFSKTPEFTKRPTKEPDQFDNYIRLNDVVYLSDSATAFITFWDNYDRMYKAKVAGLCTGIAAGGFCLAGGLVQVRNAGYTTSQNKTKGHIALYTVGGLCGVATFTCVIIDIIETKKIRDKHDRINFTGNGVIINLRNNNTKKEKEKIKLIPSWQ